jgi:hypothetical protein
MTQGIIIASDRQPASFYPDDFLEAVLPPEVDRTYCEHENGQRESHCVHDWRIHWGNVEKTGVDE